MDKENFNLMVSELKINIIKRIAGITEVSVLEDIDRLLDLASESESGYILTRKEKEAIDAGLNDLKENKVYSSEEADDMIKAIYHHYRQGIRNKGALKNHP